MRWKHLQPRKRTCIVIQTCSSKCEEDPETGTSQASQKVHAKSHKRSDDVVETIGSADKVFECDD